MFGSCHYVPVLRWKQAERLALSYLDDVDKEGMTPLVELPPRYFDDVAVQDFDATVVEIAADLTTSWGRRPVFVDLSKVPTISGTRHPVTTFSLTARQYGLTPILVTGLTRPAHFQRAVAAGSPASGAGVCIRLTRQDLSSTGFVERLRTVLSTLDVTPEKVDLVVDYAVWDSGAPSFGYLTSRIPGIERWRTFTLLAGSFPPDLRVFERPGQYEWSRDEWVSWRDQVLNKPPALLRLPAYGDYTIQFGLAVAPPDHPNVSASIRYTAEDHWVVMRGEGLFHKTSPGSKQYIANAELLCLRKEFCGAPFSYGDGYIAQVASREIATPGNPMTWLRAGINHHLVFVVRQLAHISI